MCDFSRHCKLNIIFILLFHTSSFFAFSITDSFAKTKQLLGNWIYSKKTVTSSQEYPLNQKQSINLTNISGDISVTTWNKQLIMIDISKHGSQEELDNTHIEIKSTGETFNIIVKKLSEDSNLASINFTLIVPATTNVSLATESGNISAVGSKGSLYAQTTYGNIIAEQISGALQVKSLQGSIFIEQPLFDKTKQTSIFAEAHEHITLLIPDNSNSSIRARTIKGIILSDIFITLDSITVQLNKDSYQQMKRNIKGTTGMGGIPITLETMNGNIKIMNI